MSGTRYVRCPECDGVYHLPTIWLLHRARKAAWADALPRLCA